MFNQHFSLPPRDGLSDADYIVCLEASLRIMNQILLANEQRIAAGNLMLKSLVLTSPIHRVAITPSTALKAATIDLAYDSTSNDSYVLYVKERNHVSKH